MTQRTTPDYDFYATAPPAAQSAAPASSPVGHAAAAPVNQFGTPVNQFGSPVGFGGAATMTGPVPPAATRSRTSHGVQLPAWAWRWIAGLAVAVVLGLFGVGRFAGIGALFASDLELPATLGGMAQDSTSDEAVMMSGILEDVSTSSDGAVAALYSDGYTSTMVVATPEEASEADVQHTLSHRIFSPAQRFGETTCATLTDAPVSTCMRSGNGHTVVVSHASSDFAETIALLNEAWDAL